MPDNTGPAKPEQSVVRIRYRVREGACSFRNVEPIRFHNRALVRDWVVFTGCVTLKTFGISKHIRLYF